MKKLIIYTFLTIILSIAVYGLIECDSPIEPSDVPCSVISTYQFDSCAAETVMVYDDVPTLLDDRVWDDYGTSGRCNTTFNYSERGSYLLNSSEGSSATIIVRGVKMEFLKLTIFGIFFLIGLILIAFMHKFKEDEGSSIAFGSFAVLIFVVLGSMTMFGFQIVDINTFSAPFNVNISIGMLCYLIAIYTSWYSIALFRHKKEEKNILDEEARNRY